MSGKSAGQCGSSKRSFVACAKRAVRRAYYHSPLVKVVSSSRPLVAIWRPDKHPKPIFKAIAMMAPALNIDVVYVCTYGMNLNQGTLVGKRLKPGTDEWERCVTRMPDIVDSSPYCWKNREALEYFEEHCWCTTLRRNQIPKSKLEELMAADPRVSKWAIPTVKFRQVEGLEKFARAEGDIVVKPIFSCRGRGVHRVTFDAATETFRVGFLTEEHEMDAEAFRAYAREHFIEKRHIAQRYISSRTKAGDPFDCRVHMEKNGRGEWEAASMLVRIGIGQKIISNINQGGGMAELEPFLKANRPDCAEAVVERLNELAATLPAWYEEQRQVEIMTLGIDVAITEEGEVFVFETNPIPFVDFNLGQVAMLRTAYYRWLADHRVKGR